MSGRGLVGRGEPGVSGASSVLVSLLYRCSAGSTYVTDAALSYVGCDRKHTVYAVWCVPGCRHGEGIPGQCDAQAGLP